MGAKFEFDGEKLTKRYSSSAIATVRGEKVCDKTSHSAKLTIRGDKICEGTSHSASFTVRKDKICKKASHRAFAKMKEVDKAIDGPGTVIKAALWLYFVR